MRLSPLPYLFLAAVAAASTAGCERKDPPGAAISPSAGVARAAGSTTSEVPSVSAAPSASSPAVASASASAAAEAEPPAEVDWKNEGKPSDPGLEDKGRALFEAIVSDDPDKARAFFFPQEPFTPLKDAKNPDAYWRHLYAAYEKDIHKLHRRRRDWTGVTFERMDPGTEPVWVPPGDEANKIGYYRSWGTKLRYRADGELYTVKIHTVITWQGKWYITHLLPWKKK